MEDLLNMEQTAKKLNTTLDWMYRHWKELPFTKLSPKVIRFAPEDLEQYIAQKREEA